MQVILLILFTHDHESYYYEDYRKNPTKKTGLFLFIDSNSIVSKKEKKMSSFR